MINTCKVTNIKKYATVGTLVTTEVSQNLVLLYTLVLTKLFKPLNNLYFSLQYYALRELAYCILSILHNYPVHDIDLPILTSCLRSSPSSWSGYPGRLESEMYKNGLSVVANWISGISGRNGIMGSVKEDKNMCDITWIIIVQTFKGFYQILWLCITKTICYKIRITNWQFSLQDNS